MRGALIVALGALVLAAAGCGGGKSGTSGKHGHHGHPSAGPRLTKAQYQAKLTKIVHEATVAQTAISSAAERSRSVADVEVAVRGYASAGDHFASELESLNPPADTAEANAELARGERDNANETRAVLKKLSTFKTAHQALVYLGSLAQSNGSKEINAALTTLKALGYATGT